MERSQGIEIRLFGPMRLFKDGAEIDIQRWKSKKAVTLLKLLAERCGARFPKDVLIDALWPEDADFERSTHNLHTVVYYLRRELEPGLKRYQRAKVVRQSTGLYWLEDDAGVWVDVVRFRRLLQQADSLRGADAGGALALYREALDLYLDDFLPENLYDDWAAGVREELREKYVAGVVAVAELTEKSGANGTDAINLCRRALQRDGLREELHRALIQLLARQGLYGEAAEQYRQCTRVLYDEFRVPPSPATRIAYEGVMAAAARAAATPSAVEPAVGTGTRTGTGNGTGIGTGATAGRTTAAPPSEATVAEGPTMCAPETYLLLHKLELSRQVHTGLPVSLVRIGLGAGVGGDGPDDADRARCVAAVRETLRAGDVFCWESPARMLIQLPATGGEGALLVKARLQRALERMGLVFFDIHHVILRGAGDGVAAMAEEDSHQEPGRLALLRAAGQGGTS